MSETCNILLAGKNFLCEIVTFSRNVMMIKTNFCPKFLLTGMSLKNRSLLEMVPDNALFFRNAVFSIKKKEKRSSLHIGLRFLTFHPKFTILFFKITQKKWVFVSDRPQISSRTSNISHRIQRYLPHRAKVRHAIPKNLQVMQVSHATHDLHALIPRHWCTTLTFEKHLIFLIFDHLDG